MKKYFPPSELIINEDDSVFHLHVKPEHLADKVILVGDPGRVALVASHFDTKECEVESREFRTVTGTYQGKRITVTSTGIGCDNVDIVMNELDALANINFQTREENDTFRQLEIVRIGTCGGLQPYTPVGTYICSAISVGFDGLLNFYEGRNAVCDLPMERALLNHLGWTGNVFHWLIRTRMRKSRASNIRDTASPTSRWKALHWPDWHVCKAIKLPPCVWSLRTA